jgi:hypothetical protein
MFSRKGKLVDRGRHILKEGHTPVFPVELHLTSEEKILNCAEYNTMRDRNIQEFIDSVKSVPFQLPTGEEFYLHLLFTSLEGDGKYLGGCMGLQKGNSSHSRKCMKCMALFGKSAFGLYYNAWLYFCNYYNACNMISTYPLILFTIGTFGSGSIGAAPCTTRSD